MRLVHAEAAKDKNNCIYNYIHIYIHKRECSENRVLKGLPCPQNGDAAKKLCPNYENHERVCVHFMGTLYCDGKPPQAMAGNNITIQFNTYQFITGQIKSCHFNSISAEAEVPSAAALAFFAFYVKIGEVIRHATDRLTGVPHNPLCKPEHRYPLFCIRMRCEAFLHFGRVFTRRNRKMPKNAIYSDY